GAAAGYHRELPRERSVCAVSRVPALRVIVCHLTCSCLKKRFAANPNARPGCDLPTWPMAARLSRYGLAFGIDITFPHGQPETFFGQLSEVIVYLRCVRPASERHCRHRGRSQATERLPHDVIRPGHRVDDALHELQRLLVQVRGAASCRLVHTRRGPPHGALQTLAVVQRRPGPDVCDAVCVVPAVTQRVPFLGGDGGLTVKRERRAA